MQKDRKSKNRFFLFRHILSRSVLTQPQTFLYINIYKYNNNPLTATQPKLNPTNPGSLSGQPGSYRIPQPTLVRRVVSQAPTVYPN